MAKLNLVAMATALENKSQELLDKIDEMKRDINLSENTVRTQTHLKSHEARNLLIMLQLVRNMMDCGDTETELPDDVEKWFDSTVTLVKDRNVGVLATISEGTDIIQWMQEHEEVPYAKIKKYLSTVGLALEGSTVVKA